MKYNFVYCLFDSDSCERMYFYTDSQAFRYAESQGLKNFTVEVLRVYFDLGDNYAVTD